MTPEATRRKQARLATAAVTRAEDTLAGGRGSRLDDAAWTEFAAILDRPAKRIPELAELLKSRQGTTQRA